MKSIWQDRPTAVLVTSARFTVPVVVGRMSRSREGLPASFHGPDLVYTEFGLDVWNYVLKSGFDSVSINALDYPTALAITAR
jgi:hypothetical protein